MNLSQWALKHGVPWAALEDLRRQFNIDSQDAGEGGTEAAVQKRVVLEASRKGGRLWRNNVGVLPNPSGVPVRYGLCNTSAAVNEVCKSSDLIGITPVAITPSHVGRVLGVFTAREVKPEGWQYSGTEREVAQLNFIQLVSSLGGDAAFANREGTL